MNPWGLPLGPPPLPPEAASSPYPYGVTVVHPPPPIGVVGEESAARPPLPSLHGLPLSACPPLPMYPPYPHAMLVAHAASSAGAPQPPPPPPPPPPPSGLYHRPLSLDSDGAMPRVGVTPFYIPRAPLYTGQWPSTAPSAGWPLAQPGVAPVTVAAGAPAGFVPYGYTPSSPYGLPLGVGSSPSPSGSVPPSLPPSVGTTRPWSSQPPSTGSSSRSPAPVATSGSPPAAATPAAVSAAVTAVAKAAKVAAAKDAAAKEAARSRAAAHRASVDSSVARDTRRAALRRFRKKRPLPAAGRDWSSSVTPSSTPGSSSDAVDAPVGGGVGGVGGVGGSVCGVATGRGEPAERRPTGGVKSVSRRSSAPVKLPPTPPDRTPALPVRPAGSSLTHLPGTWREGRRAWPDARPSAAGAATYGAGPCSDARVHPLDGPPLKRSRPAVAALAERQVAPIMAAPWDQLPSSRAGSDGVHVPS